MYVPYRIFQHRHIPRSTANSMTRMPRALPRRRTKGGGTLTRNSSNGSVATASSSAEAVLIPSSPEIQPAQHSFIHSPPTINGFEIHNQLGMPPEYWARKSFACQERSNDSRTVEEFEPPMPAPMSPPWLEATRAGNEAEGPVDQQGEQPFNQQGEHVLNLQAGQGSK